jgi:hypothetical protein
MADRTVEELAAALRDMADTIDINQGDAVGTWALDESVLREAAAALAVFSTGVARARESMERARHHDGCEAEGVYHKFNVSRTDGADQPGGKHDGCWYFVLDPTHDLQARVALGIYAELARQNHREPLADDLWQRPELAYDPSYIDTRLAELATQHALARFYREAKT